MAEYKDLLRKLRRGFGNAAGKAAQLDTYQAACDEAADAIESIQRKLRVAEEALAALIDRVDRNGGLGDYNGGPAFALGRARAALAVIREKP